VKKGRSHREWAYFTYLARLFDAIYARSEYDRCFDKTSTTSMLHHVFDGYIEILDNQSYTGFSRPATAKPTREKFSPHGGRK